jgi:hypothetical protein
VGQSRDVTNLFGDWAAQNCPRDLNLFLVSKDVKIPCSERVCLRGGYPGGRKHKGKQEGPQVYLMSGTLVVGALLLPQDDARASSR